MRKRKKPLRLRLVIQERRHCMELFLEGRSIASLMRKFSTSRCVVEDCIREFWK